MAWYPPMHGFRFRPPLPPFFFHDTFPATSPSGGSCGQPMLFCLSAGCTGRELDRGSRPRMADLALGEVSPGEGFRQSSMSEPPPVSSSLY